MHATAQVIQRNLNQFEAYEHIVVFGLPEGESLSELSYEAAITFDYRVFCSLESQLGERLHFSIEPIAKQHFDAAIVFLPKAKEELELILAYLTPMLKSGASLYLVGEKKAGINSAAKKLDKYGTNNSKLDSAKHCQLWHVTLDQDVSEFNLKNWMDNYTIEVDGTRLDIVTIPGVFSYGRLDEGTRLLLETLPKALYKNIEGRVLDFGCGSGVIGAYVAKTMPATSVEMIDINLLALECSKATLEKNDVQAKVYPSDGLANVTGRVNGIVTNPPFHSGVKTEYTTTESFIRHALDKMNKHAPLVLVANSFLKYGPIMEQSFGSFVIVTEDRKFKLYQCRR